MSCFDKWFIKSRFFKVFKPTVGVDDIKEIFDAGRESMINADYDKGYSDGFADGSNNFEDALLADCIACYLVANGCASTTSGNRIFSFEEIAAHFNITVDKVKELKDDITDRLYDFPQITDSEGVIVEDNEFNLMFFLNYCDVEDE